MKFIFGREVFRTMEASPFVFSCIKLVLTIEVA